MPIQIHMKSPIYQNVITLPHYDLNAMINLKLNHIVRYSCNIIMGMLTNIHILKGWEEEHTVTNFEKHALWFYYIIYLASIKGKTKTVKCIIYFITISDTFNSCVNCAGAQSDFC